MAVDITRWIDNLLASPTTSGSSVHLRFLSRQSLRCQHTIRFTLLTAPRKRCERAVRCRPTRALLCVYQCLAYHLRPSHNIKERRDSKPAASPIG